MPRSLDRLCPLKAADRDRPDGRWPGHGPGRLSVRGPVSGTVSATVSLTVTCAMVGLLIPGLPAVRAQNLAAPPADEPVLIVDLRAAGTPEREATQRQLAVALDEHERVSPVPLDSGLAAVLLGPPEAAEYPDLAPLLGELDRAAVLRRNGDCKQALDVADATIAALAVEQAARANRPEAAIVTRTLVSAHGHALACAHQLGNTGRALAAAQWLRALGQSDAAPPPEVGADLSRAYPAVDALGNAAIVELAITTEPAGAQVWFDHRAVGTAPVTVLAAEGAHLVAAASADLSAGQRLQLSQAALPRVAWGQSQVMVVHLNLAPAPVPALEQDWRVEAAAVARWRSTGTVDGVELTALLARLDVRVALVLVDADARLVRSGAPRTQAAQIWAVPPGSTQAQRVGTGQIDRPEAIMTRLAARVAGGEGAASSAGETALDPRAPLLREGDVPRRFGSRPGERRVARKPWWAYATIIGAVAATSLLILATDLGEDRQRIELRWP